MFATKEDQIEFNRSKEELAGVVSSLRETVGSTSMEVIKWNYKS